MCLFSAVTCTSQCNLHSYRRAFARKERNLDCGVHVTAENKHTLPPFGSLDWFWIMRPQRSRRRDKGNSETKMTSTYSMMSHMRYD